MVVVPAPFQKFEDEPDEGYLPDGMNNSNTKSLYEWQKRVEVHGWSV
jgi:hypothetical protein